MCVLVSILLLLVALPRAEAGIPIPVGFGDQISEIYDLPDKDFGGKNIGYMYGSLRILFIPIITWGGKFVIFEKNTYGELDADELKAIEAKYGSMKRRVGLWVRTVNYLWLFIIPIGVFLWFKSQSAE